MWAGRGEKKEDGRDRLMIERKAVNFIRQAFNPDRQGIRADNRGVGFERRGTVKFRLQGCVLQGKEYRGAARQEDEGNQNDIDEFDRYHRATPEYGYIAGTNGRR